MLKVTLKRMGIGFLLGVAIGNLIAALTGHPSIVSPELIARTGSLSAALLVQSLLSGLYGAAAWGGMSLYDIERWPMAASFGVHYLLIAVLYALIARVLGWASGMADILIINGIQLVVYFIIWLCIWSHYRKQVRELNELRKKSESARRGVDKDDTERNG